MLKTIIFFSVLEVILLHCAGANELKIVSRNEWIAKPPTHPSASLKTPVPYVIIAHTVTQGCTIQTACTSLVRNIQLYHMQNNQMWDIAYNFLVGGDGLAYQGRGWTAQGSHTAKYNVKSIGIAFIGNFSRNYPDQNQIEAAKVLIQLGVQMGHIAEDHKLIGACQVKNTESPGTQLFEDIKNWPNWSPKP